MHEDIDDFEPDWDSYYSMDDNERQVRNAKYKLYLRLDKNKITFDEFYEELDNPVFYSIPLPSWVLT